MTTIIICSVFGYATARLLLYIERSDRNENRVDPDKLFHRIQIEINRANTIEMQMKANRMIKDYISRYGQTPRATRLQMQLQKKRLNIPELN